MPIPSNDRSASGLLIVVLAGLAFFSGCGSDDAAEPATTTTASSTSTETDRSTDGADTSETTEAEATEAGSGADGAEEGADSDYSPFEDVDPASSPFFRAFEDTDVVDRIGEQEVYERGVTICRDFDNGTTLDNEIDRLLGAGFGEDTPLLMAAAVTGICPQHVDTTGG